MRRSLPLSAWRHSSVSSSSCAPRCDAHHAHAATAALPTAARPVDLLPTAPAYRRPSYRRPAYYRHPSHRRPSQVEFVSRGGDPRLLEGCLNVVLTGNPGAGKTTAARLLFRALRAYGLLKKNVFVERNALELKGTHIGWTCPQVLPGRQLCSLAHPGGAN